MKLFIYLNMILLMTVFLVTGCTKQNLGFQASPSTAQDTSSPGAVYAAPTVSCNVSSNGTVLMNVNGATGASAINTSVTPTAPASIDVNCANSSSNSGTALNMLVSFNNQSYNVSGSSLSISSLPAVSPGTYPVTVTLTDGMQLQSKVSFLVSVACSDGEYAPLSWPFASSFSISQGSEVGEVNVTLASASGGSGQYQYELDVNGDERYDGYNGELFQSANSGQSVSYQNMYTLYSGTRTVNVVIRDAVCGNSITESGPVNFANLLPVAQSGGTAQQESYYYLQGNVNPASDTDSDPADNVQPFEAVESTSDSPMVHIDTCEMANGTFTIDGTNVYVQGGNDQSALSQDMNLSINNIPANASTYSGASTVSYQTEDSGDGGVFPGNVFQSSAGGCSANINISSQVTTSSPCSSGSPATNTVYTYTGTFSCPQLNSSSSSKAVSISNGYFFCQQGSYNGCVGGGGGGGGNPPPAM